MMRINICQKTIDQVQFIIIIDVRIVMKFFFLEKRVNFTNYFRIGMTISDTSFALRQPSISTTIANDVEGKNWRKFFQKIHLCNNSNTMMEKDDLIRTTIMMKIMAASRFDSKIFNESNLFSKINMIIKVSFCSFKSFKVSKSKISKFFKKIRHRSI